MAFVGAFAAKTFGGIARHSGIRDPHLFQQTTARRSHSVGARPTPRLHWYRGGNSKLDLARFAIGSFNADSSATQGRGGKELSEITLAFHLPFPFFRRHYDGGLAASPSNRLRTFGERMVDYCAQVCLGPCHCPGSS